MNGNTTAPVNEATSDAVGVESDVLFERLRRDGDVAAREELVRRFLPLARKLATRYTNPYEPFEDLLQVASIGLLGAVDRFDPSRGVGFPSFAIPTILGELREATPLAGDGNFRVQGDLTFHGVTRTVTGEVRVGIDDGALVIEGEQVFDVREFGITPPRILMLRVDPDVMVRIRLVARPV